MVHVYTSSNTTAPIGRIEDYNNTNPSRNVAIYRTLSTNTNWQPITKSHNQTNFAQLVYGDGPYSLAHPNAISDTNAQNIDYLA